MIIHHRQVRIFYDKQKECYPYNKWFTKLQKSDILLINNRIERIKNGNYGDYKSVGNGILELRFKQGFRIYFTEVNNTIVLLFCGGDKSSQQKDIEKAKEYKSILDEKGLEYCVE